MSQSSTFQLTITPLKPATIPADEPILVAAEKILDASRSWKPGKTYHQVVKTFTEPKTQADGAPWHCRVSEHTPQEATFDQFWDKLGNNKAVNEKDYIPDIQKATQVKVISPTQEIWTMRYKFPGPLSSRVFTVLQVRRMSDSPRAGTIVSIPVDLSADPELAKLEEKGVKGRYVGVEQLLELENGNTEWRMATSSSPGGNIPNFLTEMSINSKISEDVPHFLNWLKSASAKEPENAK
ncbi:hypothetical protein AAF712_006451 [Marasmius tenuissimus]|uniref:DUF3074 domain-containing protein n=1 Tax=Marasmius tenuissimus TaxID=585030 RepID=A0ABR2ZZ51_9AGAR